MNMMNTNLTQVDERTSESGFKDAIDRQEFQYKDKIEKLEKKIEDVDKVTDLINKEIWNIHNKN